MKMITLRLSDWKKLEAGEEIKIPCKGRFKNKTVRIKTLLCKKSTEDGTVFYDAEFYYKGKMIWGSFQREYTFSRLIAQAKVSLQFLNEDGFSLSSDGKRYFL